MPKKKKEEKIEFNTPEERKAHLKKKLNEINRKYGAKLITFASQEQEWEKQAIGIKEVDEFLGGGIPKGRFSVIWGNSGSGKSTLAYHLTAQAQKEGQSVAYIDLENSFNPERASKFGIDLNELIIAHFPIAEESLDFMIELAKDKLVDVIILDSIHGLAPKGEQQEKSGKQKSLDKDTMALLARKLSQFFRMASHHIYKGKVAVLLIGQTRTDIGGFIAFQKLSGGNALKHNAVLIVHIRRGQKTDFPRRKYKDEEGKVKHEIIGFDAVLKIDKTQVSGTKVELSEIHLPCYFKSGFIKEERNED